MRVFAVASYLSTLSVRPHFAHKELLTSRVATDLKKCAFMLFWSSTGNFATAMQLPEAKFWELFASHKACTRRPEQTCKRLMPNQSIQSWQNVKMYLFIYLLLFITHRWTTHNSCGYS